MNRNEHLLTAFAEELGETAKEIFKALRFGLDDQLTMNPNGPRGTEGPTNRDKIIAEFIDALGLYWFLVSEGILPDIGIETSSAELLERFQAKREKVEAFMGYARRVDALNQIPKLSTMACFAGMEDKPFRYLWEGPGTSGFGDAASLGEIAHRFSQAREQEIMAEIRMEPSKATTGERAFGEHFDEEAMKRMRSTHVEEPRQMGKRARQGGLLAQIMAVDSLPDYMRGMLDVINNGGALIIPRGRCAPHVPIPIILRKVAGHQCHWQRGVTFERHDAGVEHWDLMHNGKAMARVQVNAAGWSSFLAHGDGWFKWGEHKEKSEAMEAMEKQAASTFQGCAPRQEVTIRLEVDTKGVQETLKRMREEAELRAPLVVTIKGEECTWFPFEEGWGLYQGANRACPMMAIVTESASIHAEAKPWKLETFMGMQTMGYEETAERARAGAERALAV